MVNKFRIGIDIDSFFKGMTEDKVSESSDESSRINNIENLIKGNSRSMVLKDWKTPREWLSDSRFSNHVGYEIWSQRESFAHLNAPDDDEWNDDDVYTAMAMKHVIEVIDTYLFDHAKQSARNDDYSFWCRKVASTFIEGTSFMNTVCSESKIHNRVF